MLRRRIRNHWRDAALPTAMATLAFVAPGAHDLLVPAADAERTNQNAMGHRTSAPLIVSTDLAVGATDFHFFTEQNNDVRVY